MYPSWVFDVIVLVSPISVYTKFLVNARCQYETLNQRSTSKFCPGYSDAKVLPLGGSKTDKLQMFANVFCSRCQAEDGFCRKLFCPPENLVVEVAMIMIDSVCSELNVEDQRCYDAYCKRGISKRNVNTDTTPNSHNIICKAAGDWLHVEGMSGWCARNCPMGNDDKTCLAIYCDCRSPEEIRVTTPSAMSLTTCTKWKASPPYSGVSGMTAWCNTVCKLGTCPHSHCQCAQKYESTDKPPTTQSTPHVSVQSVSSQHSSFSSVDPTVKEISESSISPSTAPGASSSSCVQTVSAVSPERTTQAPSASSVSSLSTQLPISQETSAMSYSTNVGTTLSNTNAAEPSNSPTATGTFDSSSVPTHSAFPTETPTRVSSESTTSPSTISTSIEFSSDTSFSSSGTVSTTLPATSSVVPSTSSTTLAALTSKGTSVLPSDKTVSAVTSETSTMMSSESTASSSAPSSDVRTPSTTVEATIATASSNPPVTLTTSTLSVTTTERLAINETGRMISGLSVMNNVICAHTSSLGQTTITNRHCRARTNGDELSKTGYSIEIIDRVLKFAPSLMCSIMSENEQCYSLFCGENPLVEAAVKASMCSVCRLLSTVGDGCSEAYCTT